MTNVVLYINDVPYTPEPLTIDCSPPFGDPWAYETLFTCTGIHHYERAYMITLEMFTKGFYILGFDLTLDREADEVHINLPRQGNVLIEARLKNRYQDPSVTFCMLNFLDTSQLTTLET